MKIFDVVFLAMAMALPAVTVAAVQVDLTDGISLTEAVVIAQQEDPWLQGSRLKQEALVAQSFAAGTLSDPVVSLGLANLPTDSFDFDQEAMTQFKVGLSQTFARGDSLQLEQERLALLGSRQPYLREDRKAKVAVTVAQLWLDSFLARESIRLIELDRSLFEYLVDVAQSSYASAVGKTRQQDIIRAQLELTRLEDRLSVLHQRADVVDGQLGEWLAAGLPAPAVVTWTQASSGQRFKLDETLPTIDLIEAASLLSIAPLDEQLVGRYLSSHPAVLSLDNRIDAQRTGVSIAEQKYKPQWGVNASYGHRDGEPTGGDRADFFSLGVTFDLPLFTANRQDKQMQSAVAMAEAVRTEKWLLLRAMRAKLESQRSQLLRLNQRRALYANQLLTQMHEQAEVSLSAYTSDDGDFSEVVRARISELNAKIEAVGIEVERAKTMVQLNYFFAGMRPSEPIAGESS